MARTSPSPCTINLFMLSAKEKIHFLRSKTLSWLNEELDRVLPKQISEDIRNYFSSNIYFLKPLSNTQHKKAKQRACVDIQSTRVSLDSFVFVCNCKKKCNSQVLVLALILKYTCLLTSLF